MRLNRPSRGEATDWGPAPPRGGRLHATTISGDGFTLLKPAPKNTWICIVRQVRPHWDASALLRLGGSGLL